MQRFVQLALDFLTGPDPMVKPLVPEAPRVDGPPAEPMSAVFQSGAWQHPRANRRVKLAGCDVAYEFTRGKRRTIGLSVGPEGLSVRAPRWTTISEVEAFMHEKAAWVLDKLRMPRASARARWSARKRSGPMGPSSISWDSASACGWTRRHGFQPGGRGAGACQRRQTGDPPAGAGATTRAKRRSATPRRPG